MASRQSLNPKLVSFHRFLPVFLYCLPLLCGSWQTDGDGLFSTLLVYMIPVVWVLGFFFVRKAVIKYSQKMMMKVSKDENREQDFKQNLEETPATHQPKLLDLDSQKGLKDDLAQATEQRETIIKQLSKLWRKKLFYAIFVFLGYLILPVLFVHFFEDKPQVEEEGYLVVVTLVAIYVVLILLQFFAFRKQFRALDNQKRFSLSYPVVGLFRRLTHPRVERIALNILIFFVIIVSILDILGVQSNSDIPTSPYAGMALLIMAFIHRQLYIILRKGANKLPSIKLVILRVFGRQKNNKFTFERLLHYWKHFGPTYTVIDPSYLYHHYSLLSTRGIKSLLAVLALILVISIIAYSAMEISAIQILGMSHYDSEAIILTLIVATSWLVYWLYWKRQMKKRFAKSQEHIQKHFKKIEKRPRNWDLSYRNLHLNCFDNTWKLAVNSFVHRSDAILMDLRGFSKERQGCQYEVNFIIDTFPIEGIVFLVDSNSDKELIHQLILDQWQVQWVDSPNLKNDKSDVTIFVSNKEDEVDLQTLMDLLINSSQRVKGIEKPVIPAWAS